MYAVGLGACGVWSSGPKVESHVIAEGLHFGARSAHVELAVLYLFRFDTAGSSHLQKDLQPKTTTALP